MDKIAVIIPAYNEEASISGVVQTLHKVSTQNSLFLDVIVVNDCSTDSTTQLISKLDCTPLNLGVNLGIGGAVQTGFKYAFNNGYDFAIQVDGDGQHPAEEIPNLLNALKQNNWDVVIGSRFLNKAGFQSTFLRRSGIGFFRFLNRLLVGVDIKDSTSGFRLLNRKALAIVNEYYPDEYPEPEAIVLFAKNKLKIGEVPVVMRERQGGVSSISKSQSVYYMFKVGLAVIFTFIKTK